MERRLGRGTRIVVGPILPNELHKVPNMSDRLTSPDPHQPRTQFDPASLEELTESVRRHGILHRSWSDPRQRDSRSFPGERRWRAARAAGHASIPVSVRPDITDAQMLELATWSRMSSARIFNALERGAGIPPHMEALDLTQEQVAEKVGLRRSTVANHVRLLDLPAPAHRRL